MSLIISEWIEGPTMSSVRAGATASKLHDGRLLIVGGDNASTQITSVDILSVDGSTITPAAPLNVARSYHHAVVLQDGRILVVGGGTTGTAEVYDPILNTWTLTATPPIPPSTAIIEFVMLVLPNGKVFLAGGRPSNGFPPTNTYNTVFLWDPSLGTWSTVAPMAHTRTGPAGYLLPNGNVLIAGGQSTGAVPRSDSEIYNVLGNSWSAGPSFPDGIPKVYALAFQLHDGRPVIAGGVDEGESTEQFAQNTTFVYNTTLNIWAAAGNMIQGREDGSASCVNSIPVMPNGRAVAVGGNTSLGSGSDNPVSTAEYFDPFTLTWNALPGITTTPNGIGEPTYGIAGDGSVFEFGGDTNDSIYQPDARTFKSVGSLLLVNTEPGDDVRPAVPGEPARMSLRTIGGDTDVLPGDTQAFMGLTHVLNQGFLPENDTNLSNLGVVTSLRTSEHRQPINAIVPRSLSGTSIVFTKSDNSDNDEGIYELQFPIQTGASILGYFKFRTNTAWTLFNPDWLNLTNATGMYFGLEHGTFNTGVFAFLRKFSTGHGSLVVGGPLQTFNAARPGQTEFSAFDWLALPNNTVVEVWIYYNSTGYPPPFSPPYVPVVEIWTRRQGVDAVPVIQAQVATSTFGHFQPPSSNFSNYRNGPSTNAVLYFGNVGRTGDVLQLDDWALYPDFRFAVSEGEALPTCERIFVPDVPSQYFAEKGALPQDASPNDWIPVSDSGFLVPATSFIFQPGRKSVPQSVRLTKILVQGSAFQRREPRLEDQLDGAMIEAFMSGIQTGLASDSFAAGLSIEDGDFVYSAVLLQTATQLSIGIAKNPLGTAVADFYTPVDSSSNLLEIDWTSLKLIRLTVDRRRGKVSLMVDENRVLEIPLSGTFPPSSVGYGRMIFGHLYQMATTGELDVSKLTYMNRFKAWEVIDQLLPNNPLAAPGFDLAVNGMGSVAFDASPPNATQVQINKPDFGISGTHCYFNLPESVFETKGIQVDFKAKVLAYTDVTGNLFKSLTWTGAGLQIWLGTKRLHLGFFDAGTNGRVIGIIPGSGSASDIINQTTLGRSFSAPADWTNDVYVRLVMHAYNSIQVWVGNVVMEPLITIPWRGDLGGFDLPADLSPSSVAFGHFDEMSSSKTAWKFIRYGVSTGYDMSVNLDYPNGLQPYLFGGKVLVRSVFEG